LSCSAIDMVQIFPCDSLVENGEKEKNFFINYINVNDKFIIVKFQLLKIFF